MIDEAISELAPAVGARVACSAVGESRARYYRRHPRNPAPPKPERVPAPQPRALSFAERAEIRATLNGEEHQEDALATVYAKLFDKRLYLGSVSTM